MGEGLHFEYAFAPRNPSDRGPCISGHDDAPMVMMLGDDPQQHLAVRADRVRKDVADLREPHDTAANREMGSGSSVGSTDERKDNRDCTSDAKCRFKLFHWSFACTFELLYSP
jgi:hypothetical protein